MRTAAGEPLLTTSANASVDPTVLSGVLNITLTGQACGKFPCAPGANCSALVTMPLDSGKVAAVEAAGAALRRRALRRLLSGNALTAAQLACVRMGADGASFAADEACCSVQSYSAAGGDATASISCGGTYMLAAYPSRQPAGGGEVPPPADEPAPAPAPAPTPAPVSPGNSCCHFCFALTMATPALQLLDCSQHHHTVPLTLTPIFFNIAGPCTVHSAQGHSSP